ncbi:hypothetical protein AA14337_2933 [Acetobacter malorum DSM 14337]|uniref:Uncharacterized protein n=1 Tax=Acetobacter malorum DSM 14337 TaxID=1307910 RepID=A0ABQ0PYP5_9PROT|nr:hypothetical protein [Acetobacter malorum]KXV06765.1 hypothetical protein AD930_06605 [Acetobacter malorum]GBQ84860.1 hypothetical protein AA14337_2933 [Acetobacter malorum DSM 14337]
METFTFACNVNMNVNYSGEKGLVEIPSAVNVPFDLNVDDCPNLRTIAPDLVVGDRLSMRRCTSLKSFPDNMYIPGRLILSGCSGLELIGEGLKVGDGLYLDGCTSLTELPKDLHVESGIIELTGCEGIRIPQEVIDRHANGALINFPDNYSIIPKQA